VWFEALGWDVNEPSDLKKFCICSKHFTSKKLSMSGKLSANAYPILYLDTESKTELTSSNGLNVPHSDCDVEIEEASTSSTFTSSTNEIRHSGCNGDMNAASTSTSSTPSKRSVSVQTSPSLSAHSPRKTKLRGVIKQLKRKKDTLEKRIKQYEEERFTIDDLTPFISPTLAQLLANEMKLWQRSPQRASFHRNPNEE